jgi:hypothetical protein
MKIVSNLLDESAGRLAELASGICPVILAATFYTHKIILVFRSISK